MPTESLTSNAVIQDPNSPTSSGLHYTSNAIIGTLITNFYSYITSSGTLGLPGYGDRWQITFSGTWVHDEKWGLTFTSTAGDYDIGSVNFFTAMLGLTPCSTFKNRIYVGAGPQFNFSDNSDPTGWGVQNPGAGVVQYLSYFGGQDAVYALSQLQGRLVVIARRSIQIWSVDADPNNFALVQEMDNLGSAGPLSVQNRGDYDVIILDDTGFRSIRTMEVTLNAYMDDIGVPVDSFVQDDLRAVSAATCVSTVDPATKNYWGYLNGKIYVHARYPSSKISAWTQYFPTYESLSTVNANNANYVASADTITVVVGSTYKWTPGAHEVLITDGVTTLTAAGYITPAITTLTVTGTGATVTYTGLLQLITVTTFTPQKFVIYNGQVYCRGANRELLLYGGVGNNTYDGCVVTMQTPWLDDKQPKLMKIGQGADVAIQGYWHIKLGYDPTTQTLLPAFDGVNPTGNETVDSTYDLLRLGLSQKGTHFLVQVVSDPTWHQTATVSEIQIHYNKGNQQG